MHYEFNLVSADNPTLATAGLIDLAEAMSLPAGGSPPTALRRLWAELAKRSDWLLIYDNVEDPTSLAQLRPPDSGRLLITSRNQMISHLADVVEVAEFDRSESVALLQRRCPALSDEQADQVAAAVADLPLAVEQAGCFLADTGFDAADYLDLLATQPAQAGLADPTVDRHPGLVAVVTTSHTRLQAANSSAATLLDQLAFCAPEPLPVIPQRRGQGRGMDRFGVQFGDTAITASVVRDLKGLGLARQAGTALQIHRLVQALLRARLTASEQILTRRAAQQLLATANPGDPDDPASWPSYATLIPHVQALTEYPRPELGTGGPEPDQFRTMLLAVARYLYASGQYRTARHLAAQSYHRWTQTLGPSHPDTLNLANNLANALYGLGDLTAARDQYQEILTKRRVLGRDHPDTLRSANNLATALNGLGDFAAARDLLEDTLARRRRVLGGDHPDTLRSANNLANTLVGMGEFGPARDLCQDTLARCQRVLGVDHPFTLNSANNLAEALFALSEYRAARDLHQDTFARRRRVLGHDHPHTLYSANNLAEALYALRDFAGARHLWQDTLERSRRVLGKDSPHTQKTTQRLARLDGPQPDNSAGGRVEI